MAAYPSRASSAVGLLSLLMMWSGQGNAFQVGAPAWETDSPNAAMSYGRWYASGEALLSLSLEHNGSAYGALDSVSVFTTGGAHYEDCVVRKQYVDGSAAFFPFDGYTGKTGGITVSQPVRTLMREGNVGFVSGSIELFEAQCWLDAGQALNGSTYYFGLPLDPGATRYVAAPAFEPNNQYGVMWGGHWLAYGGATKMRVPLKGGTPEANGLPVLANVSVYASICLPDCSVRRHRTDGSGTLYAFASESRYHEVYRDQYIYNVGWGDLMEAECYMGDGCAIDGASYKYRD